MLPRQGQLNFLNTQQVHVAVAAFTSSLSRQLGPGHQGASVGSLLAASVGKRTIAGTADDARTASVGYGSPARLRNGAAGAAKPRSTQHAASLSSSWDHWDHWDNWDHSYACRVPMLVGQLSSQNTCICTITNIKGRSKFGGRSFSFNIQSSQLTIGHNSTSDTPRRCPHRHNNQHSSLSHTGKRLDSLRARLQRTYSPVWAANLFAATLLTAAAELVIEPSNYIRIISVKKWATVDGLRLRATLACSRSLSRSSV